MAKWMVAAKKADFDELSTTYGIDPVVARIMINRDLTPDRFETYLHPSEEDFFDGSLLKDSDLAVDFLLSAISSGQKIRVIGDYDVDGIQSTYILKTGITRCGGIVDYAIPHRIEDGYGLNPSMIEKAHEDGISLVITCDNGISAREAVSLAKELGMTVVITDHHEVPYEETRGKRKMILPAADAIVDPKREDCGYPFKEICGAVVAWKLMRLLYAKCKVPMEEWMDFIENAAFATVGDIMPLKSENRSIVALGLKRLTASKSLGMRCLIEATGLKGKNLEAYHIGFVLGPCLNAAGRLDTAALGIALLEEKDEEKAYERANELRDLNEARKAMTEEGTARARQIIEEEAMADDQVLVVYVPDLHESLAGIVAGRIKEAYYRPTIVLTDAKEGVKGSGRSIPGYSMFEKLHEVEDIFTKYGGHPMAAGVSLPREKVDELHDRLNANAHLSPEDLQEKILIDVPVPLSYLSFGFIEQLAVLEPFGNGNEKPVFAQKDAEIVSILPMGKEKNVLKIMVETGYGRMPAMCFRDTEGFQKAFIDAYGEEVWKDSLRGNSHGAKMTFTYYPQINVYRDSRTIQVVIGQVLFR